MIITQEALEVCNADLPGIYDWDTGISACVDLGDRWRMPTKDDLDAMWKRKDRLGGFADAHYWSASAYNENYAWLQSFATGNQNLINSACKYRVRPVRDVV